MDELRKLVDSLPHKPFFGVALLAWQTAANNAQAAELWQTLQRQGLVNDNAGLISAAQRIERLR